MQVSRRRSDGVIVQYGHGLGEREDCDLVTLTEEQATAVSDLMAARSGGVVLDGKGELSALPAPKVVRYKTAADYRTEYDNPLTLPTRKREITDVLLGLRDPERA